MGIPDTILFRNTDGALKLFEIGRLCEHPPEAESIAMANGLVNSAPLIIGIAALWHAANSQSMFTASPGL